MTWHPQTEGLSKCERGTMIAATCLHGTSIVRRDRPQSKRNNRTSGDLMCQNILAKDG
jgi:hypothetical protein